MKENIEEDIECIQEFLEYSQDMINDMDYERPVDVTIYQNQINSLEHILFDYKRVLKENEELKDRWDKDTHKLQNDLDIANAEKIELQKERDAIYSDYQDLGKEKWKADEAILFLTERLENSIPKQKIKDKIEEIKSYKGLVIYERCNYESQIKTLQDLLEEKGE